MRNEFRPFRSAVFALCFLSLFTLRAYAQDRDQSQDANHKKDHPNGIVQDWSRHHVVYPRFGPIKSMISLQNDPRAILSWQAAEREDWHRAKDLKNDKDKDADGDRDREGGGHHRHPHGANSNFHRDWTISLGLGGTAPAMYPAKFSFDINATPTCAAGGGVTIPDYIVYPIDTFGLSFLQATGDVTNGSSTIPITSGTITPPYVGQRVIGTGIPANATILSMVGNPASSITLSTNATATTSGETITITGQPNIVGFNNLYSGSAGGTGICNRTSPPAGDDGVSATTLWSYNVTAAGGRVRTSPALSLDGTKVAFVESATGTTAHFHVLAWKTGDGIDTTTPNAQDVLLPVTITTFTDPAAPVVGSGTASDLALVPVLGIAGDTISSPFVEYNTDMAYIGNNSGTLFRVKDVFCTVSPACSGGAPPAPSFDASWGVGGALATGCPGRLTGPVVAGTGNVFVGCSDGKLYGFTPAGVAIPGSPLAVGDGTSTSTENVGGIVDPPLVDAVNGFLFVVSGSSGASSVMVQAGTSSFLSPAPITATLGAGGLFPLHLPAFNDAYFSSTFSAVANVQGATPPGTVSSPGSTSNWQIYEWANSASAGNPEILYGVGFNSSHVMTSGPAANFLEISSTQTAEFSPLTEFLNGSTDQLYVSTLGASPPNLYEYNLTDFAPGLFPNALFPISTTGPAGGSMHVGNGTGGIVVDNVSTSPQTSSIYFSEVDAGGAVKLTQSGLN